MTHSLDCKEMARELVDLLQLHSAPVAIAFCAEPPEGLSLFEGQVPPPAGGGRSGKVPAGCVFWMEGNNRAFSTAPEDHYNCSVGSLTHGLKSLEEAAGGSDVAALVESGWVTLEMAQRIPTIKERPAFIAYGPLEQGAFDPDVVLLRLNPRQAMVLYDAMPDVSFEGKPQCHIVPMAKENNQIAVSVGCMLSRVRTGIPSNEMTCAIPAPRLAEVLAALKDTIRADRAVAAYAAADAERFGRTLPAGL